MSRGIDLDSYVDVASRIAEFRTKHPEGSLQPADATQPYRVEKIGDQTYLVVVAAAYRSPDDQRPGIGMAYEEFPGRTPYTRGSELQNAETSAWGRAIVAALAADTRRGVASQEEVRNRTAERDQRTPKERAEPDERVELRRRIAALADEMGLPRDSVADTFLGNYQVSIRDADAEKLRAFLVDLEADRAYQKEVTTA